MKKLILIFWLLFYGCAEINNPEIECKSNTIIGTVLVVGNMPFTRLGIRTRENMYYNLSLERKLESYFITKQGVTFLFYYSNMFTELGDKTIVVTGFKQIN